MDDGVWWRIIQTKDKDFFNVLLSDFELNEA